MKRIASIIILMLAVATMASAQTPAAVLDQAVAALRGAGMVTATYKLTSSQGNSAGTIVLSGDKFRLISPDMKTWFDGTTQWTFSTATGEVNITTPTASDLQMLNPYAAVQGFKKNCNMWKAAGQIPGCYAIMLRPKTKSDISQMWLYVSSSTHMLQNAHFKMTNGQTFTISLSGYKTHQSLPASTFTFDVSMVPPGTEVVDLR